jgi:hypothetical protein
MSSQNPTVEDYVQLFQKYGKDLGSIYQEPDDERYALLFEQVVRLLVRPSPYNLSLPQQFCVTARRYQNGDPGTVKHMSDPANRHFMLCDLHDMVMLKGGLALKRRTQSS